MKTKALLLFAVVLHVVVLTTGGQVFGWDGVNAVGYVNVLLKPGFNLVASPLSSDDNSIGGLFKNVQGGVPGGLSVHKLVNGQYITATWDDLDNKFYPESAAAEMMQFGDGVFVFLPGFEDKVLTFVGEVPQGEHCTNVPHGYSIKSSLFPMSINFGSVGFPFSPGDRVFRLSNGVFNVFEYDELDNKFVPDLPTITVGEAFFYYRAGAPTQWCRTFFINNPQ